mgnify:CR=1 FL=1
MKRSALLLLASCAILAAVLSPAAGKDRLIAYPVPLNPDTQSLKLKYSPVDYTGPAVVTIYDVNGEKIFSRSCADLGLFQWKGYTDKGKHAGPGMYIVKVRYESANGAVTTDTVRILVKR